LPDVGPLAADVAYTEPRELGLDLSGVNRRREPGARVMTLDDPRRRTLTRE
jgi:hypothetical protein